jgi:hypothetical protein
VQNPHRFIDELIEIGSFAKTLRSKSQYKSSIIFATKSELKNNYMWRLQHSQLDL